MHTMQVLIWERHVPPPDAVKSCVERTKTPVHTRVFANDTLIKNEYFVAGSLKIAFSGMYSEWPIIEIICAHE